MLQIFECAWQTNYKNKREGLSSKSNDDAFGQRFRLRIKIMDITLR
jgi:hypothetical protein